MTHHDQSLAATATRCRRNSMGDQLRRSAARVPDRTAVVYKELRQTYAQLDETVNRTANAMAARGVRQGDRVALLSHNNHAFIVLRFAIARLGAVLVPINYMLNAQEVAYILGNAGATAIIAEDALVPVAAAAVEQSEAAIALHAFIRERGNAVPAGWEAVQGWMQHPNTHEPDGDSGDDEPVQILYTSGTESRPKGVMLTARSLQAQYMSCIVHGEMTANDIEVHALPMYHCAQLDCFFTPDIILGATSIILSAADPATMLEVIERERVTKLFCPPTVWISLLRHADFDRRDLKSLRKGYYGASIMPVEVIKEIDRRLPGIRLYNLYGQTEMSPVATILQPEDQLRKLGSAGRPVINVETRIVDDEDRTLPPGEVGEIVHRGPHVTLGYWKEPEKTAQAFRNGWFHSGDLGVMDEEGYLSVVDRKKDMIKTGGENVASREVEEVIYQHAAVSEVAVVGVPDAVWIEAVTAVAVLRAGAVATEAEIIAFCRERLAGYKTPKRVVFLNHLPRNASGKILKRELRLQISQS